MKWFCEKKINDGFCPVPIPELTSHIAFNTNQPVQPVVIAGG